jgi:hypothetical protein
MAYSLSAAVECSRTLMPPRTAASIKGKARGTVGQVQRIVGQVHIVPLSRSQKQPDLGRQAKPDCRKLAGMIP